MTVAELWRYPVKSMRGERLPVVNLLSYGMEQDRLYAFESDAAPPGMLRLRAPDRRRLLAFEARTGPQGTFVQTPDGLLFPVESPSLLTCLPPGLRLTYASEPQTDVRPLALISLQTVQQLAQELGTALDLQRFRANLLLNLNRPFEEDSWVGRTIRLGLQAEVRILERDPRCRFITFDPARPDADPLTPLMRLLDLHHQNRAGVYAQVITPGPIRSGDRITLSDA